MSKSVKCPKCGKRTIGPPHYSEVVCGTVYSHKPKRIGNLPILIGDSCIVYDKPSEQDERRQS